MKLSLITIIILMVGCAKPIPPQPPAPIQVQVEPVMVKPEPPKPEPPAASLFTPEEEQVIHTWMTAEDIQNLHKEITLTIKNSHKKPASIPGVCNCDPTDRNCGCIECVCQEGDPLCSCL